jgi:hypothetical protein
VRLARGLALALFVLAIALVARPSHAWVETHIEADDVRVDLERNGSAIVEHKVTLKIAGGPLKALDLRGVDRDAVPEPSGCFFSQAKDPTASSLGPTQPVDAEVMPDGKVDGEGHLPPRILKVRFPDKGLGRGVYVLVVRYATKLGDHISRDGALTKLTWRGVAWDDGFESARVTFAVPAAPTPPRATEPQDTRDDRVPLVLSSVRREAKKDLLELVRPYSARDEAILWTVLTDPRAFEATEPSRRMPPQAAPSATSLDDPEQRALVLGGAAALFLFYTLLVAAKAAEVKRASEEAGCAPRPIVPIPAPLRAIAAGMLLTVGLALELLLNHAVAGALMIVAASLFGAHLTPRWPRKARGPGKWLPVAEREALRSPPKPRGWLDVASRRGKGLLALTLVGVGIAAYLLSPVAPFRATLVVLDAVALLAVFGTGRHDELPPDPAVAPAALLRDIARRVRRELRSTPKNAVAIKPEDLRVVGRIRVPDGCPDADELRVAFAPRTPIPGLIGVEVGVVYARGAGGALALPEVLCRTIAGSPCDRALERLEKRGHATRGRRPGERVILFSPRLPTARMTAGLVAALVRATALSAQAAPSSTTTTSEPPAKQAAATKPVRRAKAA